jgi:hypothetical protein
MTGFYRRCERKKSKAENGQISNEKAVENNFIIVRSFRHCEVRSNPLIGNKAASIQQSRLLRRRSSFSQ